LNPALVTCCYVSSHPEVAGEGGRDRASASQL